MPAQLGPSQALANARINLKGNSLLLIGTTSARGIKGHTIIGPRPSHLDHDMEEILPLCLGLCPAGGDQHDPGSSSRNLHICGCCVKESPNCALFAFTCAFDPGSLPGPFVLMNLFQLWQKCFSRGGLLHTQWCEIRTIPYVCKRHYRQN